MKNKELVLNLIQQDLKHCQLLYGLESIGLDGGGAHHLGILELIAKLMKVPSGQINERLSTVYIDFMEDAVNYRSESLKPLARKCYRQLKALLKYENVCLEIPK